MYHVAKVTISINAIIHKLVKSTTNQKEGECTSEVHLLLTCRMHAIHDHDSHTRPQLNENRLNYCGAVWYDTCRVGGRSECRQAGWANNHNTSKYNNEIDVVNKFHSSIQLYRLVCIDFSCYA